MSLYNIEKQIEFMRNANDLYSDLEYALDRITDAVDAEEIEGTAFEDQANSAHTKVSEWIVDAEDLKCDYDRNEINQQQFLRGLRAFRDQAHKLAELFNSTTAEEYGMDVIEESRYRDQCREFYCGDR